MKQKLFRFTLIFSLLPAFCHSAVQKSGYVGDIIDLVLSKSYSELSQSPQWKVFSGPYECVTLNVAGYTNRATVRIDKYFTGTVVISCTYNTKSNMPGTESFEITCKPVYLNPSSTSMSLEVGDKEAITYTTSPSGHSPTVDFSSSNESVASVNEFTGVVTANAKGTATITLSNSEGPEATVKVSVGSGGGGGGGDDPDPNPDPSIKAGDLFYDNTPEGVSMRFNAYQGSDGLCCAVAPELNGQPCISKYTKGKITIPRTAKGLYVRGIGEYAFENCSGLTSIEIPNTMRSISSSAFKGCSGLSSVTSLNETPPTVGTYSSYIFDTNTFNNATLYVPKGCKSKYQSATGWSHFQKIEEIGGSGPDVVEPTGITVSPSSNTIGVGETFYASYTLTPSNAETSVTWYSDDTSIATVSSSGLVKGIKAGTTFINAKTSNGKEDWCKVTVTSSSPVEPTGITVSPSSMTIGVSETFYASYTLIPSNAETSVTWYSDDTSIATVSSSGLVKGIKAGTTYINAKTSNGKEDWCKVTVTSSSPVEPTGITVSPSSKTIEVGGTFYASYTLTPSNAETSVTWYSDDSNIATVSSSGLVKGIKAGTTYINAKTSNGKEDWCKVTVISTPVTASNLVITSKSGGKTILPFDSNPVLTFDGEYLVVSSTLANYSFPMDDIVDYRFDDTTDIIDKSLPPVLSNGHVIITGLPNNSFAHVFSLGGEKVLSQQANSDGVVDINIDSLPKGVYVVSAQTTKIKVINK